MTEQSDMSMDDERAVEKLLCDWFSGQNANNLQFYAEQDDLDRMVAYMKASRPDIVATLLPQLLSSPFLRQLRPPRRIPNCVPTIHFHAIKAPYKKAYNRLVKQYKLKEFIVGNYLMDFKAEAMKNGAGADIYLCFIQFGDFYAVNLLPAPGIY